MIKKFFQITLLFILFFSVGYSESNGVWHNAADIRPGTFGSDETTSGFIFGSALSVMSSLTASSFLDYENSSYYLDPSSTSNLKSSNFELISINGISLNDLFMSTSGDTMNGNLNLGNNQITGISTLDTGNGANELYAMNQNVLTTSNVIFNDISSDGILYVNEIRSYTGNSVTIRLN